MNFNIGKLYEVKKHFWLLYPTKATAMAGGVAWSSTAESTSADYWSKKLNCRVSYVPEKTFLHVVSQEKEYVRIISPEGCGWIYTPAKYMLVNECFEELTESSP